MGITGTIETNPCTSKTGFGIYKEGNQKFQKRKCGSFKPILFFKYPLQGHFPQLKIQNFHLRFIFSLYLQRQQKNAFRIILNWLFIFWHCTYNCNIVVLWQSYFQYSFLILPHFHYLPLRCACNVTQPAQSLLNFTFNQPPAMFSLERGTSLYADQ